MTNAPSKATAAHTPQEGGADGGRGARVTDLQSGAVEGACSPPPRRGSLGG